MRPALGGHLVFTISLRGTFYNKPGWLDFFNFAEFMIEEQLNAFNVLVAPQLLLLKQKEDIT